MCREPILTWLHFHQVLESSREPLLPGVILAIAEPPTASSLPSLLTAVPFPFPPMFQCRISRVAVIFRDILTCREMDLKNQNPHIPTVPTVAWSTAPRALVCSS